MENTLFPTTMNESELLKMISDEKMRNEQHKTNYQILKIEHTRLQNENLKLQSELKLFSEDNKRLVEANKKDHLLYKKELSDINVQLKLERSQKIENEEKFKTDVRNEIEEAYVDRYKRVESEANKYRDDFNKLRYDFTFLKSEYDHLKSENARIQDESKFKYELHVSHLQKEIHELQNNKSNELINDSEQLQKVCRENSQLKMRLKNVSNELENLRSQETYLKQRDEHVVLLLKKQVVEKSEAAKLLDAEKTSLLSVKDELRHELTLCRENAASVNSELASAQQEVSRLKSHIDESKHNFKLRETDLKIEFAKGSNEFERERNQLNLIIQEQKVEMEVMKDKLDKQKKSWLDREEERENKRRLSEDDKFLRITQLETDKSNLELERDSLMGRFKDLEVRLKIEKHDNAEKMLKIELKLEDLVDENGKLRDMPDMVRKLRANLEGSENENSRRQMVIEKMQFEKNSLLEVQEELLSQRATLKSALETLDKSLQESKMKFDTLNATRFQEVKALQNKISAFQTEHEQSIHAIQVDAAKESAKASDYLKSLKNKNKQYSRLIHKLRQKLEISDAKTYELEAEKSALSTYVPKLEHDRVLKKLKELEKRHSEFGAIMAFGSNNIPHSFISSSTGTTSKQSAYPDEQVLDDIRKRIEDLDQKQRFEMKELKLLSKKSEDKT